MAGDFDLRQLLAGPIIAMNDAQADAAASFYEVLDQFAFEPPDTSGNGPAVPRRLRRMSFVAERTGPGGRIEQQQISLPLFQMLPISGVSIDSATIEFSLAINAEPAPAARSARRAASAPAPARELALRGRIAPTSGGKAAAAGNLKVTIQLKETDLPAGLLDMLAQTQGGTIEPIEPAPDVGPTVRGAIFEASIVEMVPARLTPGRTAVVTLDFIPNEALVGPRGLRVEFASEPDGALEFAAEGNAVTLGRERQAYGLNMAVNRGVADRPARQDVALVVTGAAVGADGVHRSHRLRFVLPRQNGAKS